MKKLAPSTLLADLAAEFAALPEVRAIVLAGSQANKVADARSDFDVYVYATQEPAVTLRADMARKFSARTSIGNHFWEPGDEWVASGNGAVVDIMYRAPSWIEEQLDRVLLRHEASVGYSTCFLHNVLRSRPLHDRDGWFARLQERAGQPYPEALRNAIIAKNHPILRRTFSSYLHQIAVAFDRHDLVCVNHRIAAILASYFDILFAVNLLPHPGEKRLVAQVLAKCSKRPPDCQEQVNGLLSVGASTAPLDVLAQVNDLLDGLDDLLLAEGLIAPG